MVAGQKFPDFSGFKSVNESHTVTGKAIDRVLSPSELKASKAVSVSDNDCQTPDFAPMDSNGPQYHEEALWKRV